MASFQSTSANHTADAIDIIPAPPKTLRSKETSSSACSSARGDILEPLRDRIVGRVAQEDVYDPLAAIGSSRRTARSPKTWRTFRKHVSSR